MITGQVQGGDHTVLLLRAQVPAVRTQLRRAIRRGNMMLVAHIKRDKLSGQVLHRRSGALSRSVHEIYEESPNEFVGGAGTNKDYAAGHEYGFHGEVTVREHLRRSKGTRRTSGPTAGRRGGDGYHTVRAHTMKMNLPERSFMRSALRDLNQELRGLMLGAVREGLHESGEL